jgi:ATP-dependent Lon protease
MPDTDKTSAIDNSTITPTVPLTFAEEVVQLQQRISQTDMPDDLKQKAMAMVARLERIQEAENFSVEFDRTAHYIDWITSLPWTARSEDNLDLAKTREVFEKHHYGMQEIKERFLEYVSILKLRASQSNNKVLHAPVLLLVGLAGTGKTTFAYSLADAMNRKLVRIPFGGLSSARDLRGQSRLHMESEPGYIMKSLRKAGVRNPIILVDEIDRVSDSTRGEIMGVLLELLDPEQNIAFSDYYIDYPFNLSEAIFIATANNTEKVATAVLDRLEVIPMPSYTDEEKFHIGKDYLLPKALEESGLDASVITIDDDIWRNVIRPMGFDAGIRTLSRTIQYIVRRVAKLVVEGKLQTIHLTKENVKEYLPT